MGAFAASVVKNSAKILETVNNQCYDVAFELFNHVINLTPSPEMCAADGRAIFAKGLLINQWYPAEGSGNFSGELSDAISDDGADSRERITNLYGSLFDGRDGAVTLTNNVPYSGQAESTGWSNTPAYHMVALAIQYISAKSK